MSSYQIILIACSVLAFIPAIILHEVAHGYVAYKLGDFTAKNQGRLSLNPLKHVDPFGTVILPAILILSGGPVFGYAKPVPYNPNNFKNKKTGDLLVGLAGPCANLLMASLTAASSIPASCTVSNLSRLSVLFIFLPILQPNQRFHYG